MSLEEAVLANTEALWALVSVLKQHPETATQGFVGTNAQLEEVAQKAKAIGNSIVIKDLPNDKPKSQPTPDTSPGSSSESAPVTYDDVKRITIRVSEVSRDKAKAALSRFDVASAKALKEEQWPEYVKYMTRVANGEVDPEASHE